MSSRKGEGREEKREKREGICASSDAVPLKRRLGHPDGGVMQKEERKERNTLKGSPSATNTPKKEEKREGGSLGGEIYSLSVSNT